MSDRPAAGVDPTEFRHGWIRAAGRVGVALLLLALVLLARPSRPGRREVMGRWSRDYVVLVGLVAAGGVFWAGGLRGGRSAWGRASGASLRVAAETTAIGLFTLALIEGACRLLERPLAPLIGGPAVARASASLVRLNSRGLRDPERPLAKPAGTWRLLAIGDSYTFGNGLPDDSTVARHLERALATPGGARVEVVNAGIPALNTVRERALLDTLGLEYQPDLVLLQYVLNDPERQSMGYPYLLPASIAQHLRWSVAYAAARAAAHRIMVATGLRPDWYAYVRSLFREDTEDWRRHVEALHGIVEDARAAGAPVVIAVWPLPGPRRDLSDYPFPREHALALRTVEATGALVLDLMPVFAGDRYHDFALSDWDPHPNAAANRRAAAAIRSLIEARGLGPRPAQLRDHPRR